MSRQAQIILIPCSQRQRQSVKDTMRQYCLQKKAKLITPPFYDDILGGITRECIIEIARDLGYVVEEKSILRDELYTADEVFLTGTAAEVVHVNKIDGIEIGNGRKGPITSAVQDAFYKAARGGLVKYEKWLEYVR